MRLVEGFRPLAGHRPGWETYTCCDGHPDVAVCVLDNQAWPCDAARVVVETLRGVAADYPDRHDLLVRAEQIETAGDGP